MASTDSFDTIITTTKPPPNERLSLPFILREPLCILIGSGAGFLLGAAHGGTYSGLVFRAENAHRLPTSQVGWYLYHKSKNYHVMLGGIKEGVRMGARIGLWTGTFFWIEEAVDRLRGAMLRRWVGFKDKRREQRRLVLDWEAEKEKELGLERLENMRGIWVQRDFLSTTVAALGTAGAFSAWNRFPLATAARTTTLALRAGLAFGLVQDALSLMRGRRLGYVEFVRRRLFGSKRDERISTTAGAT